MNWFRQLSRAKQILLTIIVFSAIYLLWPKNSDSQPTYKTAIVETGSVTQVISETGEIMSTDMISVTSTTTGIVNQIFVENGQKVTRGDKLFSVISSATDEERAQAFSAYMIAKNTLETARATELSLQSDMFAKQNSFRLLTESDTYSDENAANQILSAYTTVENDWLASEIKYKNQQSVITQAQSALSEKYHAYLATVDSTVTAPIGGDIANLAVASGQAVSGANQVLIITNHGETWVKLSVSEADIVALSPGQHAVVSVDALGSESFDAVVSRVDEFGTDSSGVITYNVYLVISDASTKIRPAMTVQVNITTDHQDDVVIIPTSAIKPYQGGKAVQVKSQHGNDLIYVPIVLGIQGDAYAQVVSGLELGREIIIAHVTSTKSSTNGGIFGNPGGGEK